ncbi:MAG: tetratricopeptide repeat protein [bacterium]|nr:tetratricopeptide repeat protein [bacterium]
MNDYELTPFVGESRLLLVDGLVKLFDDVKRTGISRWVSFEAPSGWGKTRVGREFYARLAASQADPAYWPAAIADKRRKVTFPKEIERTPGSVPEFLWWGIGCSTRDGLPTNALIADLRQIDVHAPYVEVAWKKLESGWERRKDQISDAGKMVLKEGVSQAVEAAAEFIGAPIGLGLVLRLAHWTKGKVQEHREQADLIADSEILRIAPSLDIVDDTVEVLARATRPGFPLVLLIEDLHKADEVLLKFIDELLARASHLLIVSTTLPDVLEQYATLADLVERHSSCLHRVGYLQSADEPFPAQAGLTALEKTARAEILRFYFPDIATSTENALLERYVSPHDLEVLCNLPKLKKNYPTLQLDLDSIDKLPSGIKELYDEYWDQLPRPLRIGLAVGAVITPGNINAAESGGIWSWDHYLLREILDSLDFPTVASDEIIAELDIVPNAYAWVHIIDDCLRSFSDDSQLITASGKGLALLDEELDNPRNIILVELTKRLPHSSARATSRIHRARTIMALRAEGFLEDDAISANAILTILADLADPPREVLERMRIFEQFYELSPDTIDTGIALAIRSRGADALGEAGRVEEAISVYQDLLVELRLAFPDDRPSMLKAQVRLAGLFGEAGSVNDAVTALRHLLDDMRCLFGDDHPNTLTTRSNLAHWLGEAGRLEEAIAAYSELIHHQKRVLGDKDSITLISRSNLARWLGEAGHVEDAIAVGRAVLADQRHLLGYDHPDTLATRGNLAVALCQSGRFFEATAAFEDLLDDMKRVLGYAHPTALTTRGNQAGCLNEAGRVDEAVASYEELLDDQRRVLGCDHPDTLATRNNLTGLPRGGVEDAQLMIATCRELLDDERRILGDDHPITLTTRGNLADWLGRAGHVADAIMAYQELLVDQVRILGDGHPTVLVTRGSLAHWLGEGWHVEEAIAAYQELLVDQGQILGLDHPDALTTRANLAGLLAQTGQHNEAIPAYQELLGKQGQILGEDHPDALTTRANLAGLLAQTGQHNEAIPAYQELLGKQSQVLGEDHPATLTTRGNLAGMIGIAGRVLEAIAIYEDLLDDMRRVFGEDHPNTLTTRGNLAGMIGIAGRVLEAIAIYEDLLDDMRRVLGEDHPNTLTTRGNLAHYLAESR